MKEAYNIESKHFAIPFGKEEHYTGTTIKIIKEHFPVVNGKRENCPNLQYITTHFEVKPQEKWDILGFPLETVAAGTGLIAWRPIKGGGNNSDIYAENEIKQQDLINNKNWGAITTHESNEEGN